ncbi:MAG: response regulator [Bacteroidetes bacterium]|nr:response regulator [Bacteroidota bacterium]
MFGLKEKFALQSIRAKIIIAVLLSCLVLLFAWGISRVVFKETFSTIHKLTQPDEKLALVNRIFQQVNQLDPVQNIQALQDVQTPYLDFLARDSSLVLSLDSLKILCFEDSAQILRIDNMKKILAGREVLFASYLKYRDEVIYNRALSKRIKELSRYIAENIYNADTTIITRQQKTTTTKTVEDDISEKEKQNFINRLFRKKKNDDKEREPKITTIEDLKITIDTISVVQRDSFIQHIEAAIGNINKEGRNKVSQLLKKEFELYTTGNLFVNELQKLLHDIQSREYAAMQDNTFLLSDEFSAAFSKIGMVLLVFLSLMAILVFLIFSDISRSNKYKEELLKAKERAEQSEQVKQRFLANMSHELRTPLQSIIGFSEQLKDQNNPDKKSLDIIHQSSEHLLQIVNEVLDYSRIVSGKFVIEKRDFDMNELIAEVASSMDLQAEKKNIRFVFRANIGETNLYCGDAFRLKQILYNLLGNAVKFTNAGEVTFIVSSNETNTHTNEFTFEIKDTGIGISPEQINKIFNAFEQAADSTQRLFGGTGLGLGIVKSLVEIQGGTISVQSEKDKGSCFTVKIPYEKSTKVENMNDEKNLSQVSSFKGKILIVDDDEFIVQLFSVIAEKHKLQYISFSSSELAAKMQWDEGIQLVLLDIRMPVISGIELCNILKQKAEPHVRFIALTAQALPDERDQILKQGFNDILLKPFREKDILNLVNKTQLKASEEELNMESIEALCMHDEKLIKKTLDVFINDTSNDLKLLKSAVEEKNVEKTKNSVHRLAAKTGQLGAKALSLKLKMLEKSLMKENVFPNENFSDLFEAVECLIKKAKLYREQTDLKI